MSIPPGWCEDIAPQVLSANSNWLGLPRFDKFQEASSQMIAQRGGCEFQNSSSGHESRQVISSTIPYSLSRMSSLFGEESKCPRDPKPPRAADGITVVVHHTSLSRGSPYFGVRGTEQQQSQTYMYYPRRQRRSGSAAVRALGCQQQAHGRMAK